MRHSLGISVWSLVFLSSLSCASPAKPQAVGAKEAEATPAKTAVNADAGGAKKADSAPAKTAVSAEGVVPEHTLALAQQWSLPVATYGRRLRACALHAVLDGDRLWLNGTLVPEGVAPNDRVQKVEALAEALELRSPSEDRVITWWVTPDTPLMNFRSAFTTAALSRYGDGRIAASGKDGAYVTVDLELIVAGHPRRLTPVDVFYVLEPPRIEAWIRQGAVGSPFETGDIESAVDFLAGQLKRTAVKLETEPDLKPTAQFYLEDSRSMRDLVHALDLFQGAMLRVAMPGDVRIRVGLVSEHPKETVHVGLSPRP